MDNIRSLDFVGVDFAAPIRANIDRPNTSFWYLNNFVMNERSDLVSEQYRNTKGSVLVSNQYCKQCIIWYLNNI